MVWKRYVLSVVWFLLGSVLPLSALANSESKAAAFARFEKHGVFDPHVISEDELLTAFLEASSQEEDPARKALLTRRVLSLKWWRLWNSNWEMDAEHVLVGEPLDGVFQADEQWHWSPPQANPFEPGVPPRRLHYSLPEKGVARHRAHGVFPAILPVNGRLIQDVYFPQGQVPEQVWIRVETVYAGNSREKSTFVQARWTKREQQVLATENRASSFWAGPLNVDPQLGGWQRLHVNLLDLGLCGRERSILGIEFHVAGGEAWFGRTILRRPAVEVRGSRQYHLFSPDEPLSFDLATHNFSSETQKYSLDVTVSNYQGTELSHSEYALTIPPHDTLQKQLTVDPGPSRYLILDYRLRQGDNILYEGHSSAAIIVPNETGRKARTKFGMMYWDHPGEEMVELYRKLGVKQVVIFPEKERLNLFNTGAFDVMPMIWELPEGNAGQEEKLRELFTVYVNAGQKTFSNFWETDLRVPADMFAPHMRRFFEIAKQVDPEAIVGVGGMAWFNVAYVAQLVEAVKSSARFFDFVALMSYTTPSPPEYSGLDQESEALLTLLNTQKGPLAELWNVEWSYFDSMNLDRGVWQNTSVAREDWVPYYIRHHLFGFASGISRMIPGSPFYAGRLPLAQNYGHSMVLGGNSLFRYDLTPLPLLPAYSTMTRMLEGKNFIKSLSGPPDTFCHLYEAYDESYKTLESAKNILVFWTPFDPESVRLKLPQRVLEKEHVSFRILNMLGESSELVSHQGELHLNLSHEPQYLLLPDIRPEELHSLELVPAEPMLTLNPQRFDIRPGSTQVAVLTGQVFNPGADALQGRLRLTQPNWLKVLKSEVRYADDAGALVAEHMLSQAEQSVESPVLYLEPHQKADVRFEIQFPERIQRDAYYEQTDITRQPSFTVNAEFVAEEAVVARAESLGRVLPVLSAAMRPVLLAKEDVNHPHIEVRVTNHSLEPRQGTLELRSHTLAQVDSPNKPFAIAPGDTQVLTFAITGAPGLGKEYVWETVDSRLQRRSEPIRLEQSQPIPLEHYQKSFGYLISHGIGEGYVFEALFREQSGYEQRIGRGWAFRPAVKAKVAPVIDGRFDEWGDAAPFFVHPEGRLGGLTFFAEMYGRKMQWDGLEDFSSAWQMMWDERYLYLAVNVFDDRFVPLNELGNFWNGDRISLQVDPQPGLTDASLLPRPRDLRAIHTFDIGLSPEGPKIRRKTGDAVSGAKLAIKAETGTVLYEIAIPWSELAPLRPEVGGWMGCSLLFNEDDGHGRETKTQWYGGSNGNGLAREPRLMGDVHFVE